MQNALLTTSCRVILRNIHGNEVHRYSCVGATYLLFFFIFGLGQSGETDRDSKLFGVTCAVAILVASPFYLRNWIIYGCPIYPPPPILLRFFTPQISTAVISELLKNMMESGKGMGRGIKESLLLPFNLTYHTANFRGAGGIGLVPLALAPFGIMLLEVLAGFSPLKSHGT